METLYKVGGTLSKDFIGQISYTICLNRKYEKMDIGFSFDRQQYTPADVTEEVKREITCYCREHYGMKLPYGPDLTEKIVTNTKTEIHLLAMLNGRFIGCIHRQLAKRHMNFTASAATEGCIPQADLEGVLKVTVLVFNVLMNDTHYTLQVRAE